MIQIVDNTNGCFIDKMISFFRFTRNTLLSANTTNPILFKALEKNRPITKVIKADFTSISNADVFFFIMQSVNGTYSTNLLLST